MKKKYFTLYAILIFAVSFQINSQTVTMTADTQTTLTVFQPIDNSFNERIPTSEVELKPNLSLTYSFDFHDFGYVVFQIKGTSVKLTIPIIRGTNLNIKLVDEVFEIAGDNDKGVIFFNNILLSQGFQRHTQRIGEIFDNNMNNFENKYEELSLLIHNRIIQPFSSSLDSLQNNFSVSNSFRELIIKDIEYAIYTRIIDKYKALLRTNLPIEKSLNIKNEIDRLFSKLTISDKNISMYYYTSGFISSFYRYKYANKTMFEELKRSNELDIESTFGPYYIYLFAPDYITIPKLSNAIIIQKEYGVQEFNTSNLYSYLMNSFPESEYLHYLSTYFEVKELPNDEVLIVIEKEVNKLEELAYLPELKNNYLLIDLWATWCTPCKIEFQKKESLYEILSKYDNLKLVYLSIDEDKFYSYWKKSIKELKLEGFHIKTNSSLYKDIEKKVYGNNPFLIPRYFLMDSTGNVIVKELPRLSEIEKLRKALNEIIE